MKLNFITNRSVSVSADYTASLYVDIIFAGSAANDITVNLPQASTATDKSYYIYRTSANKNVRVDPYEGETIDGTTHWDLNNHLDCIQIYCDGSTWYVISKK